MKVNLVSYTKPAGILENSNIENLLELVAYCARVSNPANQMNALSSEKLINYLINNKHWSPLDMADITLEIETTRDISRQMIRHYSIKPQEFSQRYADVSALGEMFELSEARVQDEKNRQNSLPVVDKELQQWWQDAQQKIIDVSFAIYREAIDEKKIAKELARKVLPEGLTLTKLYMKGSIRSWIHYLEARGEGSGTQKEHMLVAAEIAKVIHELFPADFIK